jgi:hypothetical protein
MEDFLGDYQEMGIERTLSGEEYRSMLHIYIYICTYDYVCVRTYIYIYIYEDSVMKLTNGIGRKEI